jgi:murein DD-endopeptidase MepM/ murein hydrolase activator NlpD
MPTVFHSARQTQPGWSVAARAVLSTGALTLTTLASTSCLYPPRPVYRPGAKPPIEQTGAARIDAPARELDDLEYLRGRRLIIPVVGIQPEELHDDFNAVRSGGRRHHAIDILAPYGTPIIAADDGYILRVSRNRAGGNVIYATDPEERIVYYYAHLAGYYESMGAGKAITKGDTLGYVGTSGNAPENTPHLHFQIMRMRGGGRYWNGEPINPYPLLKQAGRPKREAPVAQAVTPQPTPPRPVDPDPVDPEPPPPVPPRSRR